MKKVILSCVVTALIFATLCSPVFAHNASAMGIAADQYDKGIPVYWPYHALFMSTGLVLLFSGAVVMRYHKTKNWYRSHSFLQGVGGVFVMSGLIIGIFMVARSGAPQFRYIHGILGAGTILLIAITLIVGYSITHTSFVKPGTRSAHRWMGRASLGLVMVNIVLGISMMGMVLAQ
jgi:heme A synthase